MREASSGEVAEPQPNREGGEQLSRVKQWGSRGREQLSQVKQWGREDREQLNGVKLREMDGFTPLTQRGPKDGVGGKSRGERAQGWKRSRGERCVAVAVVCSNNSEGKRPMSGGGRAGGKRSREGQATGYGAKAGGESGGNTGVGGERGDGDDQQDGRGLRYRGGLPAVKVEAESDSEEEEACQMREVEGEVAAAPGTSAGAGTSSDQAGPSTAQGGPPRWPTGRNGKLEMDQEKLQRKKFMGERESPREKLLRAHHKRGAALWKEHERTLASEREMLEQKRLAAFAGGQLGRRKQGARDAKGVSQTEWHYRNIADNCRWRAAETRKRANEWARELTDWQKAGTSGGKGGPEGAG